MDSIFASWFCANWRFFLGGGGDFWRTPPQDDLKKLNNKKIPEWNFSRRGAKAQRLLIHLLCAFAPLREAFSYHLEGDAEQNFRTQSHRGWGIGWRVRQAGGNRRHLHYSTNSTFAERFSTIKKPIKLPSAFATMGAPCHTSRSPSKPRNCQFSSI